MVDQTLAYKRNGFESTMGMLRETRDLRPVIHPPTIYPREVLAEVSANKRGCRAKVGVASREVIDVVDTKEEGIDRWPLKIDRHNLLNRVRHWAGSPLATAGSWCVPDAAPPYRDKIDGLNPYRPPCHR